MLVRLGYDMVRVRVRCESRKVIMRTAGVIAPLDGYYFSMIYKERELEQEGMIRFAYSV